MIVLTRTIGADKNAVSEAVRSTDKCGQVGDRCGVADEGAWKGQRVAVASASARGTRANDGGAYGRDALRKLVVVLTLGKASADSGDGGAFDRNTGSGVSLGYSEFEGGFSADLHSLETTTAFLDRRASYETGDESKRKDDGGEMHVY